MSKDTMYTIALSENRPNNAKHILISVTKDDNGEPLFNFCYRIDISEQFGIDHASISLNDLYRIIKFDSVDEAVHWYRTNAATFNSVANMCDVNHPKIISISMPQVTNMITLVEDTNEILRKENYNVRHQIER